MSHTLRVTQDLSADDNCVAVSGAAVKGSFRHSVVRAAHRSLHLTDRISLPVIRQHIGSMPVWWAIGIQMLAGRLVPYPDVTYTHPCHQLLQGDDLSAKIWKCQRIDRISGEKSCGNLSIVYQYFKFGTTSVFRRLSGLLLLFFEGLCNFEHFALRSAVYW